MMRTTWERGENGTSQVGKTENGKWINGEFSPDEE